jgi:phosphoglycolate phosphatase-like HAD superfamily hydrolase
MSRHPRLNIDALIFSCPDVVINVSHSYREVVRKTVQMYLEQALGLVPSTTALLTPAEIDYVQKVGNFASFWDMAKALTMFYLEMLPPIPVPTFPSKLYVPALLAYLQFAGGNLRLSIDSLREQADLKKLAHDIAAAGGGLDGAHEVLPKENRHLLVFSGDIIKTNIGGRIFQELYLGASTFEQIYQEPAIIIQSTGYAEHESMIISPEVLAELSRKLPLGLVSTRPRHEVEQSLKRQQIAQYFQAVITWDEVKAAQARLIPQPWALLEAAHLLRPIPTHTAYIGANLADIQAATAANKTVPFMAIGCLAGTEYKTKLRQAFEQNKANMILGHPDHLKELILG